ncbi:MAG: hypothetical protein MKZ56_04340 [Candidatus Thalassarchaeum sp.]|nr:hypothetical protein [Candidatus Thalassarchaeum sp.]
MAKKDEEIEGMFTLVGDPDDPDLQAADEGKLSLTDRIKKMKKKVFREDFEPSEEQRDIADQAYLRAQQVISRVTPTRVVLASVFMAALMFSVFALGFWVVPRDAVNVEVVYKQGGPGHVVLIQVHNFGSRPIANVELDASFSNQDGEVLNSTNFAIGSILAHTSVAGDNLELVITGESIWELYNIEIILDYDNYDGAVSKQSWIIEVGEYTFESHMLDAKRTWL